MRWIEPRASRRLQRTRSASTRDRSGREQREQWHSRAAPVPGPQLGDALCGVIGDVRDTSKTLEVLAIRYGITRERIRQIEARALEKLQATMVKEAA